MIILLPPSSGKTAPTSGPSLDLSSLLFGSELTTCREELIKDLHQVCSQADAAQVLKIGPNTVSDIADNLDIYEAPTTTALNLYTGVLFEAAKFNQTLENATAENSQRTVTLPADILNSEIMIFSGLWGVVRPHDFLPNYRLSASVKLPTVGTVATYWKQQLNPLLNAALKDQIVVDCRSGEYRKMWMPSAKHPCELFQVVVQREDPRTGKRSVVSHNAKHMRGVLAGALFEQRAHGKLSKEVSASQIVEIASTLPSVIDVEVSTANASGESTLTLVTSQE